MFAWQGRHDFMTRRAVFYDLLSNQKFSSEQTNFELSYKEPICSNDVDWLGKIILVIYSKAGCLHLERFRIFYNRKFNCGGMKINKGIYS